MTAQIGDRFKYEGVNYTTVARTAALNFHPMDYGILPRSICTACWGGFFCEYSIKNDQLMLDNLFINSADDKYPEINGVLPSVNTRTGEREEYFGHKVYRGLKLNFPYTGKILAGNGHISKYYIHMGYQRAWSYERLIEFEFENGKLISATDRSEDAAKLREIIDVHGYRALLSHESDPIRAAFSQKYDIKAWWL